MAKSNAERQAAYRAKQGGSARINFAVDPKSKSSLKELAGRYAITQREMLEQIIADRYAVTRLENMTGIASKPKNQGRKPEKPVIIEGKCILVSKTDIK